MNHRLPPPPFAPPSARRRRRVATAVTAAALAAATVGVGTVPAGAAAGPATVSASGAGRRDASGANAVGESGAPGASGVPPTTTASTIEEVPGSDGSVLTSPSSTTTTTTTGVNAPRTPTTVARPALPPPTVLDVPSAQQPTRDPVVVDARVDTELTSVPVASPELTVAVDHYRATLDALRSARDLETSAVIDLTELGAASRRLDDALIQARRRLAKSETRLQLLRANIERIAVANYMGGSSAVPVELDWRPEAANELGSRIVVLGAVQSRHLAEAGRHTEIVTEMTGLIAESDALLAAVRQRTEAATITRDQAIAEQLRLAALLDTDSMAVADSRLVGDVRGMDFAFVALDAYHKAAKRLAAEQPSCGIRWTLLAGIAKTESNHGTFGGSHLDITGRVSAPIIGIPLDGSNNTAVIGDTDGGLYDGDPVYDRAVGPLQFIPSTWERWGRDGNGDGFPDPQNIYDGALAAASYLCYYGPGLGSDDGIRGAVIHYNQDSSYVELVLSRAKAYDEIRVTGPSPV